MAKYKPGQVVNTSNPGGGPPDDSGYWKNKGGSGRGGGDSFWEYTGPGESKPPAPAPAANHAPAPKAHHAKGGGGSDLSGFQSMFEDMMSKYDKLLDAYLNPPAPETPQPGLGFENTILARRVNTEDEVRRPGLFPYYGTQQGQAIQRQVVDPVTGAIYPSPEAAMAAGVTSWRYTNLGQAGPQQAAAPAAAPVI
jgi:hypothetical protein